MRTIVHGIDIHPNSNDTKRETAPLTEKKDYALELSADMKNERDMKR